VSGGENLFPIAKNRHETLAPFSLFFIGIPI
jgi:hypothetical protein